MISKHTPRPFGFPAWKDIPRRIAKKHIEREMFKRFVEFCGKDKGDLVRTCTGLNARVLSVEPIYFYLRRGKILIDLEFNTSSGFCSMFNCGVSLPITYEQAIAYRDHTVQNWYGNDVWGFAERYSNMRIQSDGTFIDGE